MAEPSKASQFVGRERELARLVALLDRAGEGDGGVAVVGGDAGIGKTHLIGRFTGIARDRGAQVLEGACLEFVGRGLPFAPFVEALRAFTRSVDPGRLPALLGPGRRALGWLVPELNERPAEPAERLELDQTGQARLFEHVLGVLERIARTTPVVFVVEDLQWADGDTRDLLAFLVRHLRASRVLLVVSIRTEDVDVHDPVLPFLAELERDDGVERIEIGPFRRAELAELLAGMGLQPLSGDDLDAIAERSGGNPFFAEQLLAVASAGGGPKLTPQLRDVLLARLAELPARAQQVLRAAAAAGRQVDDDLLATILGISNRQIADALRIAIDHGLLVEVERTKESAGGYAFRHVLLQEVAYGQLLPGERARLHAAIARYLTARRDGGAVPVAPSELAAHWDAAREYGNAVPALVEAGGAAERMYAFGQARRHYERSLELWDRAGARGTGGAIDRGWVLHRAAECALLTGDVHQALEFGRASIAFAEGVVPPDRMRLGTLHDRLRWYLWEAGDHAAAEVAVAEALRVIPLQPPSALRARAVAQAAGLRMYAGDLDVAAEVATQAISLAVAADAPAEEALAEGILGWCQAVSGEIDRGIATFRHALSIAERLDAVEGIALGHANLAALLDRVGRSEASLVAALDGYAISKRLGVPRTYGGTLLGHAAKALYDMGRWREVASIVDEGLGLEPIGKSAVWLHINRARLDTNQGRYDDAASHLRRAREGRAAAGGADTNRPAVLAAEADLARWQGRLDAVRVAVDEGVELFDAEKPTDPALAWLAAHGLAAEADAAATARARLDGRAILAAEARVTLVSELMGRGSRDRGLAPDKRRDAILALCGAEAQRVAGRGDAVTWEGVAQEWEALGRPYPAAYARFRSGEAMLATRQPRAEAAVALRAAYRAVVALEAAPLRDEIELLARHARIHLQREPGDADPSSGDGATTTPELGLTDREMEVIRLVGAGWSNQQIADALFITRKTASVHVSNILGKLGVRNRVEAAAIAQRLGVGQDVPVPRDFGNS